MFHETCKLHEVQISVSTNKVVLAHSSAHLFLHCLWLLWQDNDRVSSGERGQDGRVHEAKRISYLVLHGKTLQTPELQH